MDLRLRAVRSGSSPLTRGKPIERPLDPRVGRLIPAHAGKTLLRSYPARTTAAHPRSRGENLVAAVDTTPLTGSSPLTRGKPSVPSSSLGMTWLIPAHAGKTDDGDDCLDRDGAHPRSRGENCYRR